MFDARIFLDKRTAASNNFDRERNILAQNSAIFAGDYSIHDIIYAPQAQLLTDSIRGIGELFLRLRIVKRNIWDAKPFVVSIKQTELIDVGKKSIIPIKIGFDTEDSANDYVKTNYVDTGQFVLSYEFDRIGWQYNIGEDQVDLEDIEGLLSIEFKSPTKDGLKNLLKLFNVADEDVAVGPSVVMIKKLLKR